jgi:hypothetical protein
MLPSSASADIAYARLAYAKPLGNFVLPSWCNQDVSYIGVRQFGVAAVLSTRLTALSDLVCRIVRVCSQEKVRRVHTRSVVAMVKGEQAVRDRTLRFTPCRSMRRQGFAFPADNAVPMVANAGKPRPAGIVAAALVGVLVESLGKRPVTKAQEALRGFGSHDRGPFAKVVRAGTALLARFRPAFFSKHCAFAGGV